MTIILCDEPGYRVPVGQEPVWECGGVTYGNRNPPLVPGLKCIVAGESSYGLLGYQYQSGPVDEGSMILPHGFGVPVGGKTHPKTLVAAFHFPKRNLTRNSMTGVSETKVTIAMTDSPVRPVRDLDLQAHGFVGRQSVGTITGSWTMKQKNHPGVRIVLIYCHWHSFAIDIRVGIERKDGESVQILHQDPAKYSGYTDISDLSTAVMQSGDRLWIECVIKNPLDHNLRVW